MEFVRYSDLVRQLCQIWMMTSTRQREVSAAYRRLHEVRGPLCANVLETRSLKEFTDEGGEVSVSGSRA